MKYTDEILIISPEGEETLYTNVYVHSNRKLMTNRGIFSFSGETVAIIPSNTSLSVNEGDTALWGGKRFLVVAVKNYSKLSRLFPHTKLILE